MATRAEKEEIVDEVRQSFGQAQSIILTDYRGLNVSDMNDLRRALGENGVQYRVVKNTLTKIATQDFDYAEQIEAFLQGPTAIAFGLDDPVSPAKVLVDFAEEHETLEIKAGVMNQTLLDLGRIEELAKLPSRDELLTDTVVRFNAPLQGMANALSGVLRGFVNAVDSLRRQKSEET